MASQVMYARGMNDDEIYRKWLAKGLRKRGKTGRELSRLLDREPMFASRLKNGPTRFKSAWIPVIAQYIEEPPPGWSGLEPLGFVKGIRVMGRISDRIWQETVDDADLGQISGVIDRRYPIGDQTGYIVDKNYAEFNIIRGSHVIVVALAKYKSQIELRDVLVAVKKRGSLVTYTLCTQDSLPAGYEPFGLVIAALRNLT